MAFIAGDECCPALQLHLRHEIEEWLRRFESLAEAAAAPEQFVAALAENGAAKPAPKAADIIRPRFLYRPRLIRPAPAEAVLAMRKLLLPLEFRSQLGSQFFHLLDVLSHLLQSGGVLKGPDAQHRKVR